MNGSMPGRGKDRLALAREVATELLSTVEYRRMLFVRMSAGVLPPQVETMLWHYAYGKPVEQVEMNVTRERLKAMSKEELAAMYEDGSRRLLQIVKGNSVPENVPAFPTDEETVAAKPKHFADLFNETDTKTSRQSLEEMVALNKRPA
jgi:hypothetical protein